MSGTALLIVSGGAVLLIFLLVNLYGTNYSLDKIKDKTVGHGQHGVARWATKSEIRKTYKEVLFEPQ